MVALELAKAQRGLGVDSTLLLLYASEGAEKKSDSYACAIPHRSRWTAGVAKLRSVLRSLNPDVIHHHHGLVWPWLASLSGSRVHVTHGHLPAPNTTLLSGPGIYAALTKGFSSSLIAISEPVAESWRAAGTACRKIALIPNGVDAERFHAASIDKVARIRESLSLPADRQILLWIGRLDTETKGVDRLCEILRLVHEKCYVVIVGDGSGRKYLQEQVAAAGGERKCLYVGSVADPAPYYQSADALLFTSRREPMGLVILEAAATGLPIFAFPCEGGAKALLQELGATSAQSDDANALADLINEAPWARRSPGEILTLAAKYSWEGCARRIMDVYAEVLKRREPLNAH